LDLSAIKSKNLNYKQKIAIKKAEKQQNNKEKIKQQKKD
jgi:hypothetical protein